MTEIAQTADHALRILEELGEAGPLGPTELAQRLGLNRTVVHRLLKTLAARGFVSRQDNLYRPGPALARLAETIQPDLRAVAGPVMDRVAEASGETVVLHSLDGHEAVVLDQAVATRHVVQVSHRIGARHPLTVGASGRAILAFLPADAVARILKAEEEPAPVEKSLATVRRRGYAQSHDELQLGVHGIAVPLRAADGTAFASLAILVPTSRTHDLERRVPLLTSAAHDVESGYLTAI
ncbi:IclR family transcriptional regulator [Actinomadura graeca]|uniref:IclR family transcriptional regulator n=1 Tax=Actinomadura graeca TaxID=2750812 RepID=A0ABX8QWG8_9ACTN|nr:IclR family transcriptional regulator [Actinomadura graeca]QXJ21128.1 IclR family transcriptional regulator [Actinomadura graeca]